MEKETVRMRKAREEREAQERETAKKHRGIDPRRVFSDIMESDFDASKVEVFDLTFGKRKRGKDGEEQLVSILDTGDGGKIDVFPVVARFQPTPGRTIRCYVVFRQKEVEVRGKPQTRTTGFAIPVNLREASRRGEWLGLRNNILKGVQFRTNSDGDGYYAFGPNGKIVIVPKESGFEPSTQKTANYMVSEKLSCFIAHCEVPEEEMQAGDRHEQALVLQAETAGAVLKGVDEFGMPIAGKLYDACEILGIPPTATEAEIKAAFQALADEHPDKKCAEYRKLTSNEPTDQDRQTFNFEWTLIEKARERMTLVRIREKARKKYMRAGQKEQAALGVQITVSGLAKRLRKSAGVVKAALKNVGYPGAFDKTVLMPEVAWTVVGYIASGALDTADETEAQKAKKVINLQLLMVALKAGMKYDGREASEVVSELKAMGELRPNWPDSESEASPS